MCADARVDSPADPDSGGIRQTDQSSAISAFATGLPASVLRFEFADYRHHRGFESFRQAVQDQERGVRFSSFYHANVVPGEMRFLSKFLLGQACGLASPANDLPERGREWIGHKGGLTKKFSPPVAVPPVYQVYLSFAAPGTDPTAICGSPIGGFGEVVKCEGVIDSRD